MGLPNPSMNFTPFDTLPASDLNDMVENIESLAAGTGFNAARRFVASRDTNFSITSSTPTQIPSLTKTITVPAGTFSMKVTLWVHGLYTAAATTSSYMTIWQGAPVSGTKLTEGSGYTNGGVNSCIAQKVIENPSAGSYTFNAALQNSGSGSATIEANTVYPAQLMVEL